LIRKKDLIALEERVGLERSQLMQAQIDVLSGESAAESCGKLRHRHQLAESSSTFRKNSMQQSGPYTLTSDGNRTRVHTPPKKMPPARAVFFEVIAVCENRIRGALRRVGFGRECSTLTQRIRACKREDREIPARYQKIKLRPINVSQTASGLESVELNDDILNFKKDIFDNTSDETNHA
jgi:hypothetical protein